MVRAHYATDTECVCAIQIYEQFLHRDDLSLTCGDMGETLELERPDASLLEIMLKYNSH